MYKDINPELYMASYYRIYSMYGELGAAFVAVSELALLKLKLTLLPKGEIVDIMKSIILMAILTDLDDRNNDTPIPSLLSSGFNAWKQKRKKWGGRGRSVQWRGLEGCWSDRGVWKRGRAANEAEKDDGAAEESEKEAGVANAETDKVDEETEESDKEAGVANEEPEKVDEETEESGEEPGAARETSARLRPGYRQVLQYGRKRISGKCVAEKCDKSGQLPDSNCHTCGYPLHHRCSVGAVFHNY